MSHSPIKSVVRAALFLALALCPVVVLAHARLLRSQPVADSKQRQPPSVVELWFSEALEIVGSSVVVNDQSGRRVDKNNAALSEGGKKLQVELEDLAAGAYSVEWKALSVDGHAMSGKFGFSVAASQAAVPAATPPVQPTEPQASSPRMETHAGAEPAQESSTGLALSLVRWLQYLAMLSLFGGFSLYLFVLAPALGDVSGEAPAAVARRAVALSWVSVAVLIPSSLVALVLEAGLVFDKGFGEALSPALLGQVITQTGFGGAWLLQLCSAVILAVILLFIGRGVRRAPSGHGQIWWAAMVVGALLLAAPSRTGHAAAAAKEYGLAEIADWLHLLAAGFWAGGLFHLALTAPTVLHMLDGKQRARVAQRTIRLFTRVAIPSVVLLTLTGLYNSWIHVESVAALWGTAYGKTLLVKLLLVAIMLAVGAVNNFHFGPRAARLSDAGEGADATGLAGLERGLSRALTLEALVAVAVLLVTSLLVYLAPARTHAAVSHYRVEQKIIQGRN